VREINKEFVLELYALHDQCAKSIINAGATLIYGIGKSGKPLGALLDEADYYADQMEQKFAEILSDEERGLLPDDQIFGGEK